MFRGWFEHTLDTKGRLSIPSKFREVLADKYDSRLVVIPFDNCLMSYPYREWEEIEQKVAELPDFKKDTMAFLRYFYSRSADCSIDKLGRIHIPQQLRDYAKLEKDVMLVGAFKRIEIWNKDLWETNESGVSEEEIVNTLERIGL